MKKLSIVVPAYNAERYISDTLDCLVSLAGEVDGLEAVVVDDGSTDSTADIIKLYCDKYDIFRYIRQENAGVSAARNTGLEAAGGEYVLFLDSDDLLMPGSAADFTAALDRTGADIAIGRLNCFGSAVPSFNPYADKLAVKEKIDTFDRDLLWNFLVGNKCYRRSVLIESGVRFPPLGYSEEGAFFMEFVLSGVKITGTMGAVMSYRRHDAHTDASVSQTVSAALARDCAASLRRIYAAARRALDNSTREDSEEYLGEIAYKAIYILTWQFYRRLWSADAAAMQAIREEYESFLPLLYGDAKSRLDALNSDLPGVVFCKSDIAAHPLLSVILKPGSGDASSAVNSVYAQSMPFFELIVPQSAAGCPAIGRRADFENMVILPDAGFMRAARKRARSRNILVITQDDILDDRLFRLMFRKKLPAAVTRLFLPGIFFAAKFILRRNAG